MAKVGSIERNKKVLRSINRYKDKRARLKELARNRDLPIDERFAAQIKLSALPRQSSKVRYRNRCAITGRPRGYYRRFGISRIALRDLASQALLPGVTKASW